MLQKLRPSDADKAALASSLNDPVLQADGNFDYSKVVVRKPWGYEYLIFQNDYTAVWILYIRKDCQTSLHCHPGKTTSITVLSGEARCSFLEVQVPRRPGQVLFAGQGVFHRTASVFDQGTFVMEIETPVNKRDLVRCQDDYGREGLGYETIDQMSFDRHNYNYIPFIDPGVYYNVSRRFGDCSVELCRFATSETLEAFLRSSSWDTINILKGRALNEQGETIVEAGDVLDRDGVPALMGLSVVHELEALIVKRSDTMVRMADFVVSYLRTRGVTDALFVPGTTNAHLVDAVGRDTEIRSLALQTEHAAASAAEAYAKLTGKPCVLLLSSGSSGTAALTGIAGAWVDSAPVIVLSGQPRPSDLGVPGELPLRQLANRELDVVGLVRPITKHAAVIRDPATVREELDRALLLCRTGRAGPVWLDIPIDILGMNTDESELRPLAPVEVHEPRDPGELEGQVQETLALLQAARRPVLLAGHGVRAAGADSKLIEFAEALSIPMLTSRRGADLVGEDFPLYFGRPGTYGHRAANFVIQNADLLIAIGARLSMPLIGRNYQAFARAAKKVIVDIDAQELRKRTVWPDLAIEADAGEFMHAMLKRLRHDADFGRPEWVERCQVWKSLFPPRRDYRQAPGEGVDPYWFVDALSEALNGRDIIVVDGGPSLDYVMQAFKVKAGQRIISSPGLEHQGFALPASVGACLAFQGRRVTCLCERRGLQPNVPEFQTIANYRLPVQVFVFNGKGDPSVQQVQTDYFGARHVGSGDMDVIGPLNIAKLGEAYELPTHVITQGADLPQCFERILGTTGPVLCDVRLPDGQEVAPRLVLTVRPDGKWVAKPLEDMYPFLSREELRENMIIDLLEED